jgi:hypothetical protein
MSKYFAVSKPLLPLSVTAGWFSGIANVEKGQEVENSYVYNIWYLSLNLFIFKKQKLIQDAKQVTKF